MKIKSYKNDYKEKIFAILSESGLPVSDLTNDILKHFFVALNTSGEVIGAVGMEIFGKDGLLRSLAVAANFRKRGIGIILTKKMEMEALKKGVHQVYLLTTTAADFFRKSGYETISREQAPDSIARTEEFRNICPASAAFMFKKLSSHL